MKHNKRKYIGIMVATRGQRRAVLRSYRQFAAKRVTLFSFIPSSIQWENKRIIGLCYQNNSFRVQEFSFPQVIYNRHYRASHSLLRRLEKITGRKTCFNNVSRFNKQRIDELLRKTELVSYLPDTAPYDVGSFDAELEHYKVLYLKPAKGNRGIGVFRVERTEAGEFHISQHHWSPFMISRDVVKFKHKLDKLIGTEPYIIQQEIPLLQWERNHFDVRVLVQKDRTGSWSITNIVSRIAYPGYFNTSIYKSLSASESILRQLFSEDTSCAIIRSLSDVSLQAAAAIEGLGGYHLGELSVDFGIDREERIWMIEVNGQPQKSIYKELHDVQNVYKLPIQYACLLAIKSLK